MTDTQRPDTSSDAYVSAGTRGLGNWLDSRTGYRALLKSALYERVPGGARWRYVWGSTLVFGPMSIHSNLHQRIRNQFGLADNTPCFQKLDSGLQAPHENVQFHLFKSRTYAT